MPVLLPPDPEVIQWIEALPEGQARDAVLTLRDIIRLHLPDGFEEGFSYGMVGYYVPYSIYPEGYHCPPKQPLPFAGLALQKKHISLYHMGIYSDLDLLQWFQSEHAKVSSHTLDMGKSCIRYKNPAHIPFALIGELMARMTPAHWISLYESQFRKGKK